MVWGVISPFGKKKLVVIPGILDSEGYVSTLHIDIPQFIAEYSDKNLVFMQNNAAMHTSRRSMEWFRDKGTEILAWPAKIPDFDPIENVWYLPSRKVYDGRKQYYNVEELTRAIHPSILPGTFVIIFSESESLLRIFALVLPKITEVTQCSQCDMENRNDYITSA